MKAKEIIWKEVSVLPHSANAYPKGKPYKGQMMMGRVFPVSKAQAMAFVEMGCCIAEMNGPLEKVCGYRSTIKILFCPFIKLNNG